MVIKAGDNLTDISSKILEEYAKEWTEEVSDSQYDLAISVLNEWLFASMQELNSSEIHHPDLIYPGQFYEKPSSEDVEALLGYFSNSFD